MRAAPSATPPVPPSGAQLELEHRDQRAVVVEVGGGLRSYSAAGRELLDGYAADAMCTSGRGQVLAPWPNRLRRGRYTWDGREHGLALTEPGHGNAIHGLVRWARWTVAEREPERVVMAYSPPAQPGYPFSLALAVEYALSDAGLAVRTSATNVGAAACPYGAGAHPYLTAGTPTIDPAVLRAPGASVLLSNELGIPTGTAAVEGTAFDFRQPRPLGATRLDHCFTALARDGDGLARVELRRPDDGGGVTLWLDAAYAYLMLFTGDPLPDVARRSLAVEPMTCPPNAFASGESVVRLEPGVSHTGGWGIALV